jgi:uncharacterized protein YjbI with pentapeptide repeats
MAAIHPVDPAVRLSTSRQSTPPALVPAQALAVPRAARIFTAVQFALLWLLSGVEPAQADEPDLSGRDLSLSNQQRRDLRGANLSRADLTCADFSGADLRGANLSQAKLDRIRLDGADLRGVIGWAAADLGLGMSAKGANFTGTDLREAKVAGEHSGGYFENADFTGADLTRATLHGRFHGAKFNDAKVEGALMLGADGLGSLRDDLRNRGAIVDAEGFAAAVRSGRDFSRSLLQNAPLEGADLSGAKLAGANLHSAALDRARLEGADLSGAQFYWGTATGTRFDGAQLSDAKFDKFRAAGASFEGASLVRTSLLSADLSGANFRNADLTGANLTRANLTGVDLTGAILTDAKVDAAIIDSVSGLEPATERRLGERAARWKYALADGVDRFLITWSIPLHVLLTPLAAVLGIAGYRVGSARRSFGAFVAMNCLAAMPWLAGRALALLGGSPTAQLSNLQLWSHWFSLWPLFMIGLTVLFLSSIGATGLHIYRHVFKSPRRRLFLSFSCTLLTVANCFFAIGALISLAPDA